MRTKSWRILAYNIMRFIKSENIRIDCEIEPNIFKLSDGRDHIYISRLVRAKRYRKSIATRIHKLANIYMLESIPGNIEGAFFDVGANVGELGYYARKKFPEYHAFEPECIEARCCDLNNFGGDKKTNRVALWNDDTQLVFYSKPESADSSAIEISDFDKKIDVHAIKLDTYIKQRNIKKIAVLKVEAEGAEPEVLLGAIEALRITSYLVVDCGFERGIEKKSTFLEVVNFVMKHNFQIVNWNPERLVFLFKKNN